MPNIIAAQFDDFAEVESAQQALSREGFSPSSMDAYFLNASGQHARFPIGGDQDVDPEAHGAETGALAGAAIGGVAGAALGLVAAPMAGPAAAVGAIAAGVYAGSLAGAVHSLGKGHSAPAPALSRPAGLILAVYAPTQPQRDRATRVLLLHRAHAIEEADGRWDDGAWQDFDPTSIPSWRKAPAA
ncbi:MAG: hypothetical protein ABI569_16445 [Casimicrobiaceae bacterium]